MKGDLWPGIRGVGLTHKAPNDVDPGVKRLIIKVDLVKGSVQRSRTTRSLDARTGRAASQPLHCQSAISTIGPCPHPQ